MAVLDRSNTISNSGFKKRLDVESEEIIMNMVQVAIYQFPFKSMIRETVSNALDAIREKNVARIILADPSKLSDYYVEAEGDVYNNSKFNPDYYNTKFLDSQDRVEIVYTNTEGVERDLLSIKDTGVGLGGSRLAKFFIPGASSKRLSTHSLGKYGIGAKSPLATGIGSYRVISVYNGKRFAFDIYEDKVDSAISRFNSKGEENPSEALFETYNLKGEPEIVYYEHTSDFNSVTIEIEIKKHNKAQVLEGVSSQLMYFKEDISFTETYPNYPDREINFKSNIFYEDDDVILSDSNYYSRPHFVLNGVSYGLVDFRELELDSRFGNIGLKFKMEDLDVSPSRETVTYSYKTREAVLNKYEILVKKVQSMVEKSLTTNDFLKWIRASNDILYRSSNSSNRALNTLAGLIDKHALKFQYKVDDDTYIKYDSNMKEMVGKFLVVDSMFSTHSYKRGVRRALIERKGSDLLALEFNNTVVIQLDRPSTRVSNYLLDLHGKLLIIRPDFKNETINQLVEPFIRKSLSSDDFYKQSINILSTEKDPAKLKSDLTHFEKAFLILKTLLTTSKEVVIYDDVVVPDEFNTTLQEVNSVDDYKEVLALRKQQGKFIIKGFRGLAHIVSYNKEVELSDLTSKTIIYGYAEDAENLKEVHRILTHPLDFYSITEEYAVVQIAKNNTKRLESIDAIHIDDFGFSIENGVFRVDPLLKEAVLYNFISREDCLTLTLIEKADLYPYLVGGIGKEVDIYKGLGYNRHNSRLINKLREALNIQLVYNKLTEEELDHLKVTHFGIDLADEIESFEVVSDELISNVELLRDFMNTYGSSVLHIAQNCHLKALDKQVIPDLIKSYRSRLTLEHPNL